MLNRVHTKCAFILTTIGIFGVAEQMVSVNHLFKPCARRVVVVVVVAAFAATAVDVHCYSAGVANESQKLCCVDF